MFTYFKVIVYLFFIVLYFKSVTLFYCNDVCSVWRVNEWAYFIYLCAIILPKALYGCELWNSAPPSHLDKLERSHRLCAKTIQGLPLSTSTDVALGALGLLPIEAEIDKRKLQFFSQLCRLPTHYLAKQFFVVRCQNYVNSDRQSTGFFPDIYRLLSKYNLTDIFVSFLRIGEFPSKGIWNKIINKRIKDRFTADRNNRLLPLIPMEYTNSIFKEYGPCYIWSLCRYVPSSIYHGRSAIRVLGKLLSHYQGGTCQRCNVFVGNLYMHLLFVCAKNETARNSLWQLITDHIGYDTFIHEFCNQSWFLQTVDMITGLNKYNITRSVLYPDILRHMHALVKIWHSRVLNSGHFL